MSTTEAAGRRKTKAKAATTDIPATYRPATSLADRAGMRQVADRAGVAMSSVSRVLSGHPDVSTTMRDKVLAAVEELGYEPNMLAQMLRRGATQTVGFVVGDISNPLLAQIALGAEVALRASGYAMLLTNSVNEANLDATHIRLLQQRRVDGLLLSVSDETSEETVDALARTTTPSVLIDRDLPIAEAPSAVLSDHAAGIAQAVERLVAARPRAHRPCRRFAARAADPRAHQRIGRGDRRPILVSWSRCDGRVHRDARDGSHSRTARRPPPPTAIIAGGNQILVGVLGELAARKLRIPRDISLVTCDDVPLAEVLHPDAGDDQPRPLRDGRRRRSSMLDRLGVAATEGPSCFRRSFVACRQLRRPPSHGKWSGYEPAAQESHRDRALSDLMRRREELLEHAAPACTRSGYFEDIVKDWFTRSLVRGSTHLYQGQEAVAVGVATALRPGDTTTCTYRGHGTVLAQGRAARPVVRRDPRQGQRPVRRQGRLDAPHRPDRRRARVVRDRRRASADQRRRGLGGPAAGHRRGERHVLRRRRDKHRRLPRDAEPGRRLEAPGAVRVENNLYGEYSPIATTTGNPNLTDRAARLRDARRAGRRQRRCRRVLDVARTAVERARAGEGPTLIEAHDLPADGPLALGPGHVPADGGAGRVAGARPDRSWPSDALRGTVSSRTTSTASAAGRVDTCAPRPSERCRGPSRA